MHFTTQEGKILSIDTKKWIISNNRDCKIVGEKNGNYIIQNENNIRAEISKSLIQVNQLEITDGHVSLSSGLYENYIVKPEIERSQKRFNTLFEKYSALIFKNREVVLNKAEYYLLRPDMLKSGGAHIGGFAYTLGSLFSSFKSGKHMYYDEFGGYKKMYLISVSGSPLSGVQNLLFWSEEEGKIIKPNERFDESLVVVIRKFSSLVNSDGYLDFQDQALEQLINQLT